MYNNIKISAPNIIFHSLDLNESDNGKFWKYGNKNKWAVVDYTKFQNAIRYQTGELINEICEYCEKKKCSCGGCMETDVFEWVSLSTRILPCQRCICCSDKTDNNTEVEINDTGKSLDELVKERMRKGKALRDTAEAYENGEITKVTKEGKLRRRELKKQERIN